MANATQNQLNNFSARAFASGHLGISEQCYKAIGGCAESIKTCSQLIESERGMLSSAIDTLKAVEVDTSGLYRYHDAATDRHYLAEVGQMYALSKRIDSGESPAIAYSEWCSDNVPVEAM